MTHERVGDMSVQELIETTVDQRIRAGKFLRYGSSGDRPLAEIIQDMLELRIKRESDEPSVVDMIRGGTGAMIEAYVVDTSALMQAYIEDEFTLFNSFPALQISPPLAVKRGEVVDNELLLVV